MMCFITVLENRQHPEQATTDDDANVESDSVNIKQGIGVRLILHSANILHVVVGNLGFKDTLSSMEERTFKVG
jgi:hypothetical protein